MRLNTVDMFHFLSDLMPIDAQNFPSLTGWSLHTVAPEVASRCCRVSTLILNTLPSVSPGASEFLRLEIVLQEHVVSLIMLAARVHTGSFSLSRTSGRQS